MWKEKAAMLLQRTGIGIVTQVFLDQNINIALFLEFLFPGWSVW